MKDISKATKEERRMLDALCSMYNQYCGANYGHDFMNAGEQAIEIIEEYGLGNETDGVNKDYWKLLGEEDEDKM